MKYKLSFDNAAESMKLIYSYHRYAYGMLMKAENKRLVGSLGGRYIATDTEAILAHETPWVMHITLISCM